MDALEDQLRLWGISFDLEVWGLLGLYVRELASYEKANVVGTQGVNELWLEHIIDSLSCLLYEPLWRASNLVDVGAGGGMPGIPIHLVVGFERACLLESASKKAEFLRHVSSCLAISGLEVANHRVEELGQVSGYRASFEAATVRAVAPLDVISEYCLPLLVPGGIMLAMKGRINSEELKAGKRAANILGGELVKIIQVPFSLQVQSKDRNLIIIEKTSSTPKRYPRKTGTPRKKPLGATE